MRKYLLLVKFDPPQIDPALRSLRNLPEKPSRGVNLHYSMNVFGDWDVCIWFNAETHEKAVDFVHNKICTIPGVVKTYTMPTTTIKEYVE